MDFHSRAFSREAAGKLGKLTFARIIVSTLVVCAAIAALRFAGEPRSVGPLAALLGVIYLSAALLSGAVRTGAARPPLLRIEIAIDCAVITVMVHMSGGSASPVSILYILPVIAGSIFFQTSGGVATAIAASTLYATYGLLEFGGIVHPLAMAPAFGVAGVDTLLRVALASAVFVLTGVLSGALSTSLRRRGEELADRTRELERVRFNADSIVRNVSSGLIVTDMAGAVLNANPAAARILGLGSPDQLHGKLIEDIMPHMPAFVRELRTVVTTGSPRRRHEIEVRRDGAALPLGLSVSLLTGEAGEKRGVVAIFQDLTEVHLMREKVRHADKMAAIGELSAAIAHEIRAPLASICGSVEMLASELNVEGDDRKLMDLVMKESDRLDRIITDFLEFARLRMPEPAPIDVEQTLNDVLLLLSHSTERNRNVRMRVDCLTPRPLIYADEEQIRQVFFNLMINACEAMEDGGTLTVRIDRRSTEIREGAGPMECLQIEFENDGPVIPEDVLPHIFEPFYTTKEGGTGLGLAIVSRIVESHGGLIRALSAEGIGTAFRVTLPIRAGGCPEGEGAFQEEFISF